MIFKVSILDLMYIIQYSIAGHFSSLLPFHYKNKCCDVNFIPLCICPFLSVGFLKVSLLGQRKSTILLNYTLEDLY